MNRGDKIRPVVTVIKVKNGVPTVISLGGNVYVLQVRDGYRGLKKEAERK